MATLDERTIHRLEAFSDIVIAFSLAEVGLALAIPKDLAELRSTWLSLNAFGFSFTLISIIWWYHHKLFVTYLSLNPVTIIMNFVLLGCLALGIYFQQVTVHFLAGGINPVAPLHMWLACMAAVYGMLSGMYCVGIWERRALLDRSAMHRGISIAYEMALSALGLVGLSVNFPFNLSAVVALIIVLGVAAALRDRIASYISKFLLPARAV